MFSRQSKLVLSARRKLGITQKSLYYKVYGSSEQAQIISNLERGVSGVPLDMVLAFCKALDIPHRKMVDAMVEDFRERLGG